MEFSLSVSRSMGLIYISEVGNVMNSGTFNITDGAKVNGSLDIPADEVLFMAWRQRQSPSLSDSKLRKMWREK